MLKKLKIKFVIVIMTIVTAIFALVFACIMHLTQRNIERESIQMMQTMPLERGKPAPIPPHDKNDTKMLMPFFTIAVNKDNEISAFGGEFYDLSDKELLKKLLELAEADEEQIGVLKDYDLRFCKTKTPRSYNIVFADMSNEKAMLNEFAQNTLIIGIIAYIIFFAISILLAEWMTKPVEKTWNEQKQFIADASHELKTPLTVIITNAEMLGDDVYSETQKKEFDKNILSMSKRMRGLVENLLDLARMDGGISKSEFVSVDMSKLVSDCILPFEPLFYERNVELETVISNGISVNGDTVQLKQVADILLDNALKYSFADSRVSVKLAGNGDCCLLSVSGKGETLSKTDCKNIFKRFYRIDKSRNGGESYGLGLSIADSIVQKHKGKIWAESKNNINTFFVSLPLER